MKFFLFFSEGPPLSKPNVIKHLPVFEQLSLILKTNLELFTA